MKDLENPPTLHARTHTRTHARTLFSSSGFPPSFWPAFFARAYARAVCLAGRSRARTRARTPASAFFSCSGSPPSLWPAFFAHAVVFMHAHASASARTHAHERPTTNDATCGPPAWLTGSLHEGGTRSVRSPLRRAPLLATPIATPLQGGRPERPGLFVS